jgi:hypothetical protein
MRTAICGAVWHALPVSYVNLNAGSWQTLPAWNFSCCDIQHAWRLRVQRAAVTGSNHAGDGVCQRASFAAVCVPPTCRGSVGAVLLPFR